MPLPTLFITLLLVFEEVHMAVRVDEKKQSKGTGKPVASKNDGLAPCDKPHDAEATRNQEADEACDDGVR